MLLYGAMGLSLSNRSPSSLVIRESYRALAIGSRKKGKWTEKRRNLELRSSRLHHPQPKAPGQVEIGLTSNVGTKTEQQESYNFCIRAFHLFQLRFSSPTIHLLSLSSRHSPTKARKRKRKNGIQRDKRGNRNSFPLRLMRNEASGIRSDSEQEGSSHKRIIRIGEEDNFCIG